MGFFSSFTDLIDAATPWSTAEAEAPTRGGASETSTPATKDDDGKDQGEAADPSGATPDKREVSSTPVVSGKEASGNNPDENDDEEEEEEEEEELVDPKVTLEEECKNSKECAPAKHHYDECAERVTSAQEAGKDAGEDCVEEFFHLMHCATACAAPKLWAQLK